MKIKKLFDLRGKTALVTGSDKGIGKAIALCLAEFGSNIIIHSYNESTLAKGTAEEISAFGVKVNIITGDLSLKNAAQDIFAEAMTITKTIDILILNVSVQIRNAWQKVTFEEIELQTSINFRSSLQLAQIFSQRMVEQKWGRIITIGSVQQIKPHPEMIVYSATKAALSNMVKNLALQLAPSGITVNNIAPGVINTDRNKDILSGGPYREQLLSRIPVGFFAEPYDCAPTALLLCSEAGRYITGQDYFIDGGLSL